MSEYRYKIAMKNLHLLLNTVIDSSIRFYESETVIDKDCCLFINYHSKYYSDWNHDVKNPFMGDKALKELEKEIEVDTKLLNCLKTLGTVMDLSTEPNVGYCCEHNGGGSDGNIDRHINISFYYSKFDSKTFGYDEYDGCWTVRPINSLFLTKEMAAQSIQTTWRNHQLKLT